MLTMPVMMLEISGTIFRLLGFFFIIDYHISMHIIVNRPKRVCAKLNVILLIIVENFC